MWDGGINDATRDLPRDSRRRWQCIDADCVHDYLGRIAARKKERVSAVGLVLYSDYQALLDRYLALSLRIILVGTGFSISIYRLGLWPYF